jgi:hypothetical protein
VDANTVATSIMGLNDAYLRISEHMGARPREGSRILREQAEASSDDEKATAGLSYSLSHIYLLASSDNARSAAQALQTGRLYSFHGLCRLGAESAARAMFLLDHQQERLERVRRTLNDYLHAYQSDIALCVALEASAEGIEEWRDLMIARGTRLGFDPVPPKGLSTPAFFRPKRPDATHVLKTQFANSDEFAKSSDEIKDRPGHFYKITSGFVHAQPTALHYFLEATPEQHLRRIVFGYMEMTLAFAMAAAEFMMALRWPEGAWLDQVLKHTEPIIAFQAGAL